ncbi:lysosomal Pro-X carboxypeptidase-like isoform X2 [Iris pallida]|uniref:Lysosomal Pro-X carboxypeptidase-like isoform X2 n=1 Tax=Iris pallida TaxID=29817 RepID=A0AAX6EAK8_IRIPA|nr:lysosomal Pro-X carboxypeptidase-like isoform X2 [Iris pallida]
MASINIHHHRPLLSLLPILLVLSAFTPTTTDALKLGEFKREIYSGAQSLASTDIANNDYDKYAIYYYTQTLDHFDYQPESYATFPQRYAVSNVSWGGARNDSPILVYLGGESPVDYLLKEPLFLSEIAAHCNALLVYIEHRYYGESNPFGSREEAYANSSTLGYLSSSQALADYAELIIDLKKNLSADNSPLIVAGGSYAGMLASWFRLKYPHIAIGAFASSAPILYFDDIISPQHGYLDVVTKDFRDTSESCYKTIRESWSEIDRVGSQSGGLNLLSNIFHTCSPLNNTGLLKDYLYGTYCGSAQYNVPPVTDICSQIDQAQAQGADVLHRVFSAVNSSVAHGECLDVTSGEDPSVADGWNWQKCTEMVMPIGVSSNESMFEVDPFNITEFTKGCQKDYGITPRPHWITTEFGGHNIDSVLRKFGSNILFSNGLRDPYSSGGVLRNISDSIVATYTTQGTHCSDLEHSKENDPEWLVAQRTTEITTISGWIEEYKSRAAKTS